MSRTVGLIIKKDTKPKENKAPKDTKPKESDKN